MLKYSNSVSITVALKRLESIFWYWSILISINKKIQQKQKYIKHQKANKYLILKCWNDL